MSGLSRTLILALVPLIAMAQEAPPPERSPDVPRSSVPAPDDRPPPRPAAPPEPAPAQPTAIDEQTPDAPTGPTPSPEPASRNTPPVHETLRENDFAYSACLLELTLLGADYSEEPAITDAQHRDCGIDRPITLRAPLPGIQIAGGAVMRCDTARHLAHWLRDFVRPAASLLPGQPRLVAIEPGSTYQCRATIGTEGTNLSEHAFGNAFDIAAFGFDDGTRIEIMPREGKGDMVEAFQHAVRNTACLHFSTVLGPGANAAHADHLHLDIKARNGGWRLCQ